MEVQENDARARARGADRVNDAWRRAVLLLLDVVVCEAVAFPLVDGLLCILLLCPIGGFMWKMLSFVSM
jgi:hypothetical protein